ncbi:MAG: PEP-CTERM sorting domain-containing protein, partial [Planctomycetales bacterium]|nr:PEP-CTERM sorting domain-containing protein [Planctomycetales bacterium]
STGDWNGDADFDSSDFVAAFQAGGYENGPRAAVAQVPEPGSMAMIGFGMWLLLFRERLRH